MRRVSASWRRITIGAAFACGCDPGEGESRPQGDLLPAPDDAPESREGPVAGTITPVLLVPSDRAVDPSRIDAVNGGLDDLRAWYQTQLGTHRLEMGGLQVIAGDRNVRYEEVLNVLDLLQRSRDTPHQIGMTRAERERNLRDAFWLEPRQRHRLQGAHVALIDDVFTTGATAHAAALALKRAGTASVDVWVVARTPLGDE